MRISQNMKTLRGKPGGKQNMNNHIKLSSNQKVVNLRCLFD